MKRTTAGLVTTVLVSAGLGLAGLGLAAGTANAYPLCTTYGACSTQWCPGMRLPEPDVQWDMSICHDWMPIPHEAEAVQVGSHVWEGEPCDPVGLSCFPRRVPS